AGVPDDLPPRRATLWAGGRAAAEQGNELCAPGVQHLGHAVEDLAPVHRGPLRPAGERATRRPDRVSQILAGCPGDVELLGAVGASRLRPHELAAGVQLVCLADVEPRTHQSSSYSSDSCSSSPSSMANRITWARAWLSTTNSRAAE